MSFFLRLLLCSLLLSIHSLTFATYTKVSNSGKALPDNATLGSGPNDWACTYDSNTKLIWEVKTTDGGLRDHDWTYTWYDSNSPDGNNGTTNVKDSCKTSGRCDTEKFTQDVNNQGLCGAKDWRMPAIEELRALYCSSGLGNPSAVNNQACQGTYQSPTINSQYFPNSYSSWYWSASVVSSLPNNAWFEDFGGGDGNYFKNSRNFVRLVRGGQSILVGANNAAPTASFSATPSLGNAPLSVNLDAAASTDSDGTVTTYAWTSSNGTSITNGKTSSVTFNQAGTFTISLTVTDDKGATGTATKTITVSPQATPPIQNPVTPPSSSTGGFIEGNVSDGCSFQALSDIKVQVGTEQDRTDEQGMYRIKLPFGQYQVQISEKNYNPISQNIELAREEKPSAFADFRLLPPGGCASLNHAFRYKAIIIAGSGPSLAGGKINYIWPATQKLTSQAYLALRQQGFAADRIRFLSAQPTSQDVDKDKVEDIFGLLTPENLESALQWAAEDNTQDVVVYLIGHGYADNSIGYFILNPNSPLTSTKLKSQLDILQSKITGTLSVVLDACYSGSFLKPLSHTNRYVITSTRDDRNAELLDGGINAFSNFFWKTVGLDAGNLGASFAEARQAMSKVKVDDLRNLYQEAQLDANGDGVYSKADNVIIGQYCYGACKIPEHAGVVPVILSVGPESDLAGQRSRLLSVQGDKPLKKAWATIQRPDYHFPPAGSPLASKLSIDLQCNGVTCSAMYDNFNLNDSYIVTFFVEDAEGNQASPRSITLQQSGFSDALNSQKKSRTASYEPSTGVLTLQDVLFNDTHYYVELRDPDKAQNGYSFNLSHFYPLTEATGKAIANYDGAILTVPNVLVEDQIYPNIRFNYVNGVFRLQ